MKYLGSGNCDAIFVKFRDLVLGLHIYLSDRIGVLQILTDVVAKL
jgi:hypothetical protein